MQLLFLMQVVLSLLQLCAGGLIEGSTSLLGVVAMDCVTPQLSGSSGAVATFISQRMFSNLIDLNEFLKCSWCLFCWTPFWICYQEVWLDECVPCIRISWRDIHFMHKLPIYQTLQFLHDNYHQQKTETVLKNNKAKFSFYNL